MQLSTDASPIQIRESGRMFCLCSDGRVIGFAASFGFAQVRAKELAGASSAETSTADASPADPTNDLTFCSRKAGEWIVEVLHSQAETGAFRIAGFPTAVEAWRYRDEVEAYDKSLPESEADGEWSEAQIAWFRTHPAPLAHSGVLRVRYQGVQ